MLKPIPINLGAFQNVDALEHGDDGTAHVLKNVLINDAGSNVSRPALSELCDLGDSPVVGLRHFANSIVAVTEDRNIYQVSQSGSVTDITDAALEGGSRPTFDDDGTYLVIAGGGSPKRWDGSGNTELMPGSPEDCTFVTYLDGYWILALLNDQEFRWAGPTSSARETWNSSNFFQAEGLPDAVLAHAVLLRQLFAFGRESTEVFYNYGDSSVPFKRTFFIDTGISAPNSVLKADNTLYWLDQNRRFVMLQGQTPVFLSSPFDRVIKGFGLVSDCFGYKIDIEGFYLLVWVFPTEGRTLVYDYKAKYWSEWDGYTNGESSLMKFGAYAYAQSWNKHFVGDPESGKIYQFSRSYKTDGDEIRRIIRRTGQIDHGSGIRKRSNKYLFHMKRGLGVNGEQEPVFSVRVKDDGGPWSEPEVIGLGYPGDDEGPIEVRMNGIYRKRQIEIQCTDAVDFVLKAIEEDLEAMVS